MNDSAEPCKIDLPERLDSTSAQELYAQIDAHKDKHIELNGEHVSKVGGLCLQVLIAAKDEWARNSLNFQIQSPSDALASFLSKIGRDDLTMAEAACH